MFTDAGLFRRPCELLGTEMYDLGLTEPLTMCMHPIHRVRVGFSEVSNFYKIRPIFKASNFYKIRA